VHKTTAAAGAALTLAALGLQTTGTANAAVPGPIVIDFTDETAGAKPDGYASAEAPNVLFFDTLGEELVVGDFGESQSNGMGIAVRADDASALEVRLPGRTTAISLAFGNDQPGVADTDDQAQLTLFRGTTQVDQVSIDVNANDAMDQRIAYRGKLITRVTFQYVDQAGVPLALIEVVDDVRIAPICTVVGTNGNDRLLGTSGRDVICALGGNDTVSTGGGDDLILADKGKDVVDAGAGGDKVDGGAGRDDLQGGAGRDKLDAGTGRDRCDGGPGRDKATSCEVERSIP